MPSASEIEFTVTVFPEPIFLLSKVEFAVAFNVSEPIKKQNSAFKDFKSFSIIKEKIFQKQKPLDKNFTFNILNGKIITEWKDEFLSESNLKENFVYKNTNQNYSKSRTARTFNLKLNRMEHYRKMKAVLTMMV